MKWIKEKRKSKSIYNMTKLELIANLKEKQKIIDKTKEHIYNLEKQNLNFYNILADLKEWLKEEKENSISVLYTGALIDTQDKIKELKEKYK